MCLVLGIGNPGRADDGVGPLLVEQLVRNPIAGVRVDANYQLVIEDAAAIAQHTVVVIVDADTSGPTPFWFDRIAPQGGMSFSSHSMTPGAIVHAAETLFESRASVYGLGIRGMEFDAFREGVSPQASDNMAVALSFLRERLLKRDFASHVRKRS